MKIIYVASTNKDLSSSAGFGESVQSCAQNLLPKLLKDRCEVIVYHRTNHSQKEILTSDLLANIRAADAFVGEMTTPDQTLGVAIAYASAHFVPCLYLYHESVPSARPGAIIEDNPSRKFWVKKYNENNVSDIFDKFFVMVEQQLDTSRTSFLSTKEIDHFVDKQSKIRGISKGEVIRQSLAEIARQKRENQKVVIDDFQRYALRSVALQKDNAAALSHRALGLVGESGILANQVKKIIRDKSGKTTEEDVVAVKDRLGDVLYYTTVLAEYFDLKLSDIAEANMHKSDAFRSSREQ